MTYGKKLNSYNSEEIRPSGGLNYASLSKSVKQYQATLVQDKVIQATVHKLMQDWYNDSSSVPGTVAANIRDFYSSKWRKSYVIYTCDGVQYSATVLNKEPPFLLSSARVKVKGETYKKPVKTREYQWFQDGSTNVDYKDPAMHAIHARMQLVYEGAATPEQASHISIGSKREYVMYRTEIEHLVSAVVEGIVRWVRRMPL